MLEAGFRHGAAFVVDENGATYLWRVSGEGAGIERLALRINPGVSGDLRLSPDGRFWALANNNRFFLVGTADGKPHLETGTMVGAGIAGLHFASDRRRLLLRLNPVRASRGT